MTIFSYFDIAYYINLNRRTDRRESFEQKALAAGVSPLIRIPGVELTLEEADQKPGVVIYENDSVRHLKMGSSLSHYAAIKDAKKSGYETILVFEDDAVFLPNFETVVAPYIEELKQISDWDMVWFGCSPECSFHNSGDVLTKVSDHWYMNPGANWCIHATGIHSRFFDRILAVNPHTIIPWDLNIIHYPPAKRKYLISKELLVLQDDESFSDVWGSVVKRNDTFRENYAKTIR